MPFDPNLPAANTPLDSAQMRAQLTGLQTNIQAKAFEDDCVGRMALSAVNPTAVDGLGLVVSGPTVAEVQAIADKLDELIAALKR